MHRSPFPRTQRRTRHGRTCRALKNWLPRHRSPWRRTRSRIRRRRSWHRHRRLIYRTRAGLRHDHPRRRCHWSRCFRRRGHLHLCNIRWTLCRWSRSRHSRRKGDRGRCGRCHSRGRGCGWRRRRNLGRNHDHRRRPVRRSYGSRGHNPRRRRCWRLNHGLGVHCLRRNRWSFCLRLHRRHCRWLGSRTRWRMFDCPLLLRDGPQHISRTRDMREVDLGLDLFFAVSGTRRRLRRTRRRVETAPEMAPHQVRFMVLKGTGVRFLLRDAHRGQYVKNFLALDFQLTGQIVDSNLTHPLSFPLFAALSGVFKIACLTSYA